MFNRFSLSSSLPQKRVRFFTISLSSSSSSSCSLLLLSSSPSLLLRHYYAGPLQRGEKPLEIRRLEQQREEKKQKISYKNRYELELSEQQELKEDVRRLEEEEKVDEYVKYETQPRYKARELEYANVKPIPVFREHTNTWKAYGQDFVLVFVAMPILMVAWLFAVEYSVMYLIIPLLPHLGLPKSLVVLVAFGLHVADTAFAILSFWYPLRAISFRCASSRKVFKFLVPTFPLKLVRDRLPPVLVVFFTAMFYAWIFNLNKRVSF